MGVNITWDLFVSVSILSILLLTWVFLKIGLPPSHALLTISSSKPPYCCWWYELTADLSRLRQLSDCGVRSLQGLRKTSAGLAVGLAAGGAVHVCPRFLCETNKAWGATCQ